MFNRKEKRANKDERKKGEEILKNITGGLVPNPDFVMKLTINGVNQFKVGIIINKINKQIKKELKNGELKAQAVENRIDGLIMEITGNDRIITEDEYIEAETKRQKEEQEKINKNVEETREKIKQNILNKGKVSIQIPYQGNGFASTMACGKVFGTPGLGIAALAEGNVNWKHTELLLMENGLTVKSTGDVVLYEDIKEVVLSKGGMLHTIVTIVTKDRYNFIFKVAAMDSLPVKRIIEEHITKDSADDNIDALMKYGELYEKGLITKEEFDKKKQELL